MFLNCSYVAAQNHGIFVMTDRQLIISQNCCMVLCWTVDQYGRWNGAQLKHGSLQWMYLKW